MVPKRGLSDILYVFLHYWTEVYSSRDLKNFAVPKRQLIPLLCDRFCRVVINITGWLLSGTSTRLLTNHAILPLVTVTLFAVPCT